MHMLDGLNDAIRYIEKNLVKRGSDGANSAEAARLAGLSEDSFARFFSYMTGMSLYEYIRCRRLSLAGDDLRQSDIRIIDIAMKYGYDSTDSFSRAFVKQHGLTPSSYRKKGGTLKIYPPASFHIVIKGAKKLDFRMVEMAEKTVYGISKLHDEQLYPGYGDLRNSMWSEMYDDVPGIICDGKWNQPGSTVYDGIWYGIRQNESYMIARSGEDVKDQDALEAYVIPSGNYAVFESEHPSGKAWIEFPKLFEAIFDCWLPESGYRQKGDLAIEVLHLWTDREIRKEKRYYEVWIPVEHMEVSHA